MAILKEFHRPVTIAEAIKLLQQTHVRLLPLAGGSSLIGELETRTLRDVDGVVDLNGLGLAYIHADIHEICIGATTPLTTMIEHSVAGALAGGILRRTAYHEGPINLRNVATVGGLVAAAASDSELYAALLALDAVVFTHNGHGESLTPLGQTDRGDVGVSLILEIRIPQKELRSGHARVARTPMDRPIVAAVAVSSENVERIALCGVAERPVLEGMPIAPPSNFRGSADYRKSMLTIVKDRALRAAKGG